MNALRLGLCVLLALVLPALAVAQTTSSADGRRDATESNR
jgi:hypothetical protein